MVQKELDLTVSLEPELEGGYTVLVPALPEVVTFGETEAEALEMAREAVELALEVRFERGEALPGESEPQLHRLKFALAV